MEEHKTDFDIDFLGIIAKDRELITYRKELNQITGSVTATILLQQILFWWEKQGRTPFYKFKEPCNHSLYKGGDSWCEELGFTRAEFDTALSKIGCKTSKDKHMQEDKFIRYWITPNRVTYYDINVPTLRKATFQRYLNPQSSVTKIHNPALEVTTENTSETTQRSLQTKRALNPNPEKISHTIHKENFSENSNDHLPTEVLEDISADSPAPNIPSNNKISETNPNIPDQSQITGKSEINLTSEEDSTISQTSISDSSNNIGMKLVELFCKERNGCFSDVPSPHAKMKQGWVVTMGNIIERGYKPDIIADVIKFIFNSEDPFWRGRVASPGQLRGNMDTIVQQMAAKAQKDKKKAEEKKRGEFIFK